VGGCDLMDLMLGIYLWLVDTCNFLFTLVPATKSSNVLLKGIVSRDGRSTETISVQYSLGLNIAPRISLYKCNVSNRAFLNVNWLGLDFTSLLSLGTLSRDTIPLKRHTVVARFAILHC
jgi:hypothetical protein